MTTRFLDTNVLLYAISDEPRERPKRDIAVALVEARDNALSVQVLQEFYVQATRSGRTNPLPHKTALALVQVWIERFPVQDQTVAVLRDALDIKARFGLSYWDAAVVAAALALGCRELLTEDLSHGLEIDGLAIANPFR